MTRKVVLLTPLSALDEFYTLGHSKAAFVKIEPEKLLHLTIDYSVMRNALEGSSTFQVVEPEKPTRPRNRLRSVTS